MNTVRRAAALLCLAATVTASAAPATSQAIVQGEPGLALQTVITPVPAAGQVLVKVYAAGVNPVDWKRPAKTPGFDAAGVVDSVGPGVTTFKPGDPVVAWVNGGYAQYALAKVDEVIAKPGSLTFEQGAGMPVAGVAAYRATMEAKLTPGQRVAIVGAAGGTGEAAVQIARSQGARVLAIGHSSQQQFLRGLGVDEFIAFDKEDVATRVGKVDAAINLVDGQAGAALGYVKRGGRFASIAGSPGDAQCTAAEVTCVVIGGGSYTGISNGEGLRGLAALADKGQYKVTVTRTFPLAEAAQAQEAGRTGQNVGKLILVVDADNSKKR